VSPVTAVQDPVCERGRVARGVTSWALWPALVVSCIFTCACALPSDTPTEPEPVQSVAPAPTADPNASPTPAPSWGAPAPKATPTPEPSPEPSATPEPGPTEGADGCGSPTPPALSRLNVKVHLTLESSWVLDSTPLVGPDAAYCAKVGFPDRSVCPVRPEGHPERSACELYVTGRAIDTGRPGPTWYRGSHFCTGPASGCSNHDENQYLLVVHASGTYQACARNGVCGEVDVN
jgi:hypothetical protein